ncbi:transport and golgi organization 1 isoform X2 [Xylocopa sonorina]|uniref:transport and golgi organization 1 isoform X2 n=1 Tax=Xylocopa sonorina TaxID=1818115 RepID=UPI00403AFC2C
MLVVMWNCNSRNMTEPNLFIRVLFLVIAIVFSTISQCSSALSDKRLCYDPDCSEPVSLARTSIKYIPNEPGLLPFDVNVQVKVYSKEAGNRTDLWGVEINGKHGYVPKLFLKEYKILHKKLKYEVSTSSSINNIPSNEKPKEDKPVLGTKDLNRVASTKQNNNLDGKSTEELPSKVTTVTPLYEVIDGTTVHLEHNEPPIEPTFVKKAIEATVVPNKQDEINDSGVSSVNGETKSNILTRKDEALQEILNKEETVSDKIDIKNFVTSSEEILDLPEISGVHVSPLNISAISEEVEHMTKNAENSADVKNNLSLNKVADTIVPQTPTFDDAEDILNIKNGSKVAELDEKDDVSSSEEVAIIDTKPEIQNITDTPLPESVPVVADVDVKTDEQTTETSDKVEVQDTESLKNVTIVAASDSELAIQTTETFYKIEVEKSSENVEVSNVQLDVQSEENADKIEAKDTQLLQNVSIVTIDDFVSDVQSVETSETEDKTRTEDSQSARSDTIPDVQSPENQLEDITKDVQPLESTITVTTNDTGPDMQHTESTIDIPFLENPKIETKDTQYVDSVALLQSEQNESKRKEETENIEDLNKYGNDKYVSPLFLESNIKDMTPTALPSDNIDASEMTESISEFDKKDIQSDLSIGDTLSVKEATESILHEMQVSTQSFCSADNIECSPEDVPQSDFPHHEQTPQDSENAIMSGIQIESNYWLTLMYLIVTVTATLIFSLGYYCIENMRRDRQLIARINKLEKDLLISEAECTIANENLKSTKEKLNRMEDESFGSDEMVLSLRADLEASQSANAELEDQVTMLEKDLESATEAGLELERMLREVLSSNNEVNPLAQSVEELQTRLYAQQAANESLTNALNLKTQENESLSAELASVKKKCEELEVELTRVTENLKLEMNSKNNIEHLLTEKVQQLEMQLKEISIEKATLQKELKGKEAEANDLVDVINRLNSNNLDLDKLYDVSRIKAEAKALLEERNELKVRLAEVEGAHNLLEEHVKVVKEEMATLSEQCKLAEKVKKDAETRLEVLTNFFEEKEAQRQKEEAIWLQQQGEVVSTVERIQTMQNEIQNYKQQIEMLKREILDQEREYKNHISLLETKAHEQWVVARQVERRLEESKVEAGQLRNRLTLIEKNINDIDPETKLHRLEANGETTTSPPLFLGAESSSSPIMFSGSSSVPPPPPPSYLHSLFPPYLPPPLPNTSGVPPYEVSQRPPPLGGRLSSPPPMPLHPPASNRYDNASSPPPMSPHLLPPYNHRSPPPPFGGDIHPPPPPPPGSILPPPPLGTPHSWGEESLPPPRNSSFHPAQRAERVRNHKGSLHSSGESLDKLRHNSKV